MFLLNLEYLDMNPIHSFFVRSMLHLGTEEMETYLAMQCIVTRIVITIIVVVTQEHEQMYQSFKHLATIWD